MESENEAPSILLIPNFLADQELLFERLMQEIEWDSSMKARKTASFGQPYNYSQMSYGQAEVPALLQPVADALHARLDIPFNNCLLNYYETGDNTMGFHADDTSHLLEGTGVAIVSVGSARDITFRSKEDRSRRESFTLEPGSLLYMDQIVQDHWMHAVRKQPDAGPRISLTWRAIEPPGS